MRPTYRRVQQWHLLIVMQLSDCKVGTCMSLLISSRWRSYACQFEYKNSQSTTSIRRSHRWSSDLLSRKCPSNLAPTLNITNFSNVLTSSFAESVAVCVSVSVTACKSFCHYLSLRDGVGVRVGHRPSACFCPSMCLSLWLCLSVVPQFISQSLNHSASKYFNHSVAGPVPQALPLRLSVHGSASSSFCP